MLYMREYVDIFDSINNYLCTQSGKIMRNYSQWKIHSLEWFMIYDFSADDWIRSFRISLNALQPSNKPLKQNFNKNGSLLALLVPEL